jgi:flagellar biogenesis protein FliO
MRTLVIILLGFITISPASAQVTAGGPQSSIDASFPDWQFSGSQLATPLTPPAGAPTASQPSRYGTTQAASAPEQTTIVAPQSIAEFPAPPPRDSAVEQASYNTAAPPATQETSKRDARRLAPRSESVDEPPSQPAGRTSPSDLVSRFGVGLDSTYSTISALALVLGLFFMGAWVLRKGAKKKTSALPAAVVNVLGRVTIAPKQFAELLRVGNKLVLVAITPEGPKPITEVTDPAEVDRLMGLCQQQDPRSPSRAFEHVFRELADDRAPEGFLGNEAPLIQVPLDTAAYLARGGSRRA